MKRPGIALSALLFASLLKAGEAAPAPPRPLFSTSAGLAEPGSLEMELGGQVGSFRDGCRSNAVPVQLNLGVCRWFDFRLGWSGPTTLQDAGGQTERGCGDPLAGGQGFFLAQDQAGLDLGFAYWHKFPVASVEKGLSSGRHDDSVVLTAGRVQGAWEVDLNAGANWLGTGEGRVRQPVVSCAITYAPAEGWNVTLDTYALAATSLGPRVVSSILAVSRSITPSVTVDVAVEGGLTQSAPRLGLSAGLVWRLGRLWGKNPAKGN